ncbi:mevalonate kinase [Enterococcus sp. BWT-B8]|uniref:mevalonate kinase n=1 Tax=Enterococcus sp. BWT-B8 TaxID=2885157 RepID=UPI001E2F96DF|nr:mevalonate kinase [Enterococcus sp. BWT-B8]MCB5952056.1 mevalonate kinase [Enterococcus sp. BWT-B8]
MKTIKQGIGKAAGKIILIGEHSVVYGEPAIAFPFPAAHVTTTSVPSDMMTIDCSYYSGPISHIPATLKNIREAITQTLNVLKKKEFFSFTITSTIPPERGMGSSAAVAVSVIRSIFDYYGYTYTPEELTELINHSEKIAHGNPSGIDGAAVSGSQPLFFIKGQPLQTFPMNLKNTFLIVADTGIKGQTRAAVQDVAHLFELNNKETSSHIQKLGELTLESRNAILEENSQLLGQTMDQAQKILSELTVSHPAIDRLIQAAKIQGALGAKLTGGGRGGCVIALANSQETAEKIASSFKENGAVTTWIQSLEDEQA